ncbi:MAG: SAM-dependent methyltransferase [Chitinophagaceae bacterium]
MSNATLHLLPNALVPLHIEPIPAYQANIIRSISVFFVEDLRSARRFLKKMVPELVIDDLQFFEINEHTEEALHDAERFFKAGTNVAYLSDAGCPAVADPGQTLVALAHRMQVRVVPHVGPNSLLLALMASGFNGQSFQFHGYLPNKQPALTQSIQKLETESRTKNQTQLFIETPYRNNQLLQELLKHLHPQTRLCVACNLTAPEEQIVSLSVAEWKKQTYDFHKKPCVFLIYSN